MEKPRLMALMLALVYLAVCMIYIHLSGYVASRLADSVEELQRLEAIKGTGFVVVTSCMLFVYSLILFRSIANREKRLKEQRDALIALERRASTGIFASSVAHDINNVLVICEGALEDLEADNPPEPAEAAELRNELHDALRELRELAARLHNVGEAGDAQGNPTEEDLVRLVKKTVALAKSHRDVRFCGIHLDLPDSLRVPVEPSMIHQLLLNLILNAAQATNFEGSILIRVRKAADRAVIDVHDNGTGIPEERRSDVFSPFYSTRNEGSGLGLLAVQAYVNRHNGTVEVHDSYLGGACFRVTLPLNSNEAGTPLLQHE
jgi:two-component system sensor histidine kinase HydH